MAIVFQLCLLIILINYYIDVSFIVCKCPYHLNNLLKNLAFRFSHYDIDGHLIDASPTSIDYFIEQLQFPPNIGQNQPFQHVICAFENEPIHDDLIEFSSPPDASLRYQLLDEQNQIQFEKQFHIQPHFHPFACFAFYLLSFNAFAAQQTRKYNRL